MARLGMKIAGAALSVGLAAGCGGGGEAQPNKPYVSDPVIDGSANEEVQSTHGETTASSEAAVESPLCVALYGLEAALAEEADPTSSIAEVEGALGITPEGGYPITDTQSIDQLGDVLGATSTAELVAPDPSAVEPALVTQASEATAIAIESNCQ